MHFTIYGDIYRREEKIFPIDWTKKWYSYDRIIYKYLMYDLHATFFSWKIKILSQGVFALQHFLSYIIILGPSVSPKVHSFCSLYQLLPVDHFLVMTLKWPWTTAYELPLLALWNSHLPVIFMFLLWFFKGKEWG